MCHTDTVEAPTLTLCWLNSKSVIFYSVLFLSLSVLNYGVKFWLFFKPNFVQTHRVEGGRLKNPVRKNKSLLPSVLFCLLPGFLLSFLPSFLAGTNMSWSESIYLWIRPAVEMSMRELEKNLQLLLGTFSSASTSESMLIGWSRGSTSHLRKNRTGKCGHMWSWPACLFFTVHIILVYFI